MRKYVAFAELPEWQRAIGARIRSARKSYRLSQTKLGSLVGLTRDQLNNIELGRVPLRFRQGWNLCVELDLNPAWLLSGEGDWRGFVDLGGMDEVGEDELFSNVMEDLMGEDYGSPGGWPGYAKYREDYFKSAPERKARQDLASRLAPLSDWLKRVSPERHPHFWQSIYKSARDFVAVENSERKTYLTKQLEFGKVGSMKLQNVSFWPELRERIRKLVRKRGTKSALARDIGVKRQRINALLSKKRPFGPTAEISLRLSKWVEIAEAQQKQNAGTAANRTGAKTRERKSKNEKKPNSDRKKK